MIFDVDTLYLQYENLIVAHLCISNIFYDRDNCHRPQAYQRYDFVSSQKSKMNIEGIEIGNRPIFTERNIFKADIFNPDNNLDDISSTSNHSSKIPFLVTQPINFIVRTDVIIKAPNNMNVAHCAFEMIESIIHNILSIDNVTYSLKAWSEAYPPGGFQWKVQEIVAKNISQTYTHLFQRQQQTLAYLLGHKYLTLDALYLTCAL